MINLKNSPQMILLHPHKVLIKIIMKNKMNTMIKFKRRARIKGEMRMMGIREKHHHTQEYTTMFKEITLLITYLVISKKEVTTRSHVVIFCEHYSFVSSFKPFKVKDSQRDPDWVVAMQEELNNFKRNEL
jgi:hypothetical protein